MDYAFHSLMWVLFNFGVVREAIDKDSAKDTLSNFKQILEAGELSNIKEEHINVVKKLLQKDVARFNSLLKYGPEQQRSLLVGLGFALLVGAGGLIILIMLIILVLRWLI
jgi:hypothetical protein